MLEKEMREKICPYTRRNETTRSSCNGSDCAMWEWYGKKHVMDMPEDEVFNEEEGWQVEVNSVTREVSLFRIVVSKTDGDCGLKPKFIRV